MNKIDSNISLDFVNVTEVEKKIIEKKIEEYVIIDPKTINNIVETMLWKI